LEASDKKKAKQHASISMNSQWSVRWTGQGYRAWERYANVTERYKTKWTKYAICKISNEESWKWKVARMPIVAVTDLGLMFIHSAYTGNDPQVFLGINHSIVSIVQTKETAPRDRGRLAHGRKKGLLTMRVDRHV
jgi:hypothetical protein